MRVYLASWFNSKEAMIIRAEQLRSNGIEVTSRWLKETIKAGTEIKDVKAEYLRTTAREDLEDILRADTVVLNVPSEEELNTKDTSLAAWARGGRHFEAGFQYATMVFSRRITDDISRRRLIIVGHQENVFHYLDDVFKNGQAGKLILPTILTFDIWDKALEYLIYISVSEPVNA